MSYTISVPDSTWSTQSVTLDKTNFIIELKYKRRTKRWYLTLRDSEDNILLSEKKIVPQMDLTSLYDIPELYGAIWCERIFGSAAYPTRKNFGVGKAFELRYMTEDELNTFIEMGDVTEKELG